MPALLCCAGVRKGENLSVLRQAQYDNGDAKPAVSLAVAFERLVEQLTFDPLFSELEVVMWSVRGTRSPNLSLTIDKSGGMDLETITRVTKHINRALEDYEVYELYVESAGLERPLVKPEDYTRFAGKNVKVITTLAIGGAKTHRGRLEGVHGTNVVIVQGENELPIPLAVIKSANLEYDPSADLQRAKREKNEKQ